MKKKITAFVLVLASLLAFASCKKKNDGLLSDTDALTDAETEYVPFVPVFDYSYEIFEDIQIVHESEDGRRWTKFLRYPVISGMPDEELQTKINDTFIDIAEAQYKKNVPDIDLFILEDTLANYEVSEVEVTYASNSFLSVRNKAYLMTSISECPEEPVYTVNISLETGEIIDEDDIFSDFTKAAASFIAGDFTKVYGMDDLMSQTNYEDMILQYRSDYASYPEVWFTPEFLGINIDLVPALGTSAGFTVPLASALDFIKFTPTK